MKKESITDRHIIAIFFLFMIGSSSIFIMGVQAKKDLWLATLLAIFGAIPFVLIYSRLYYIFPEKDFLDIIQICFGKILGKGIIIIYILFFHFWAADVLMNFGSFIFVVSLHNTPINVPMIGIIILCAWVTKGGIETLGRWSNFFIKIPIIILFLSIFMLIPQMNLSNFLPLFIQDFKSIFAGTLNTIIAPFAQIIAFAVAITTFKKRTSPLKIYTKGIILSGVYLLILSEMSILVIGMNTAMSSYFPVYTAISRIHIGAAIQRIEILIAITFVLGGFVKVSILLICACKGISKITENANYEIFITPVMLQIINLTYFEYEGVIHYYEFQSDYWASFVTPFQIIFPVIVLLIAEVRKKALCQT